MEREEGSGRRSRLANFLLWFGSGPKIIIIRPLGKEAVTRIDLIESSPLIRSDQIRSKPLAISSHFISLTVRNNRPAQCFDKQAIVDNEAARDRGRRRAGP